MTTNNKNFNVKNGLSVNGTEVINSTANATFSHVVVDSVSLSTGEQIGGSDQYARDTANTLSSVVNYQAGRTNDALDKANYAGEHSNAAFSIANSAFNVACTASILAQTANTTASNANTTASVSTTIAQNALNAAFSANVKASAAFDTANNFYNLIPSLDGYATQSYVGQQISNLVNSAPQTLDTLSELATALGNDANLSTTLSNRIGSVSLTSNAAFNKANTIEQFANAAFDKANAAIDSANAAYSLATTAFNSAETLALVANTALADSNTAIRYVNEANYRVGLAFDKANSSTDLAQSAFDKANTGGGSSTSLTNNNHSLILTSDGILSLPVAGATGTASWYFDGNSGLKLPASSNLQFGSGDFTIEFWMKAGSNQAYYSTINDASPNNSAVCVSLGGGGGIPGKIGFQASSEGGFIVGSTTVWDNEWHHIACVKQSGNGYIFIDGVLDAFTSNWGGVTNAYLSEGQIGRSSYGGGQSSDNTYTGYLSNYRLVKGTALYTSNFATPGLPLTSIQGTQILTLQDSTIIDNSTNLYSFNVVGYSPTYSLTFGLDAQSTLKSFVQSNNNINLVANNSQWYFQTDGKLKLPPNGDILFANGASVIGIGGSGASEDQYARNQANAAFNTANLAINQASASFDAANLSFNLVPGSSPVSTNQYLGIDSITVSHGKAIFNGSNYLSVPNDNIFNVGTNDFTVETHFILESYSSFYNNARMFSLGNYAEGGNLQLEVNLGALYLHINGSYNIYSYNMVPGTDYHLAVVRQSGSVTLYINGVSIGTQYQPGNINNPADFTLGAQSVGNGNFLGTLYNFRFVKNSAVYTANFTPPNDVELISGTALLLRMLNGNSSTFIDQGLYNNTVTNHNNVIQSAQVGGLYTTAWKTLSGGGSLTDISTDVLPLFPQVYDIGSVSNRWYDGYFSNKLDINGAAITGNESGVVVNALLAGQLLFSDNMVTPAAGQYSGNAGVFAINGNLSVEGDWMKVPVVATYQQVDAVDPNITNTITPQQSGEEGMIRYNRDTGVFEGYNGIQWVALSQ